MKILSASIQNYRVHEAVVVEFHPTMSLIGGNNEAGKSTLVEAIHRALFLPAKGATKVHEAMERTDARDKPTVEVCFEHQGREFALLKHFGGTRNYKVELREKGRPTLEDEAAEDMLRELTGAGLDKSPRKEEDVRKPWAHLWVWQGAAGDTPTEFIEGATDQLLEMTKAGAGTVTMSPLDTAVAHKFGALYREGHTGTGKTKTASDLGRALVHQEDCTARVAELRTQVQRLEGAARQHGQAARVLAEAEPRRAQTQREIEGLRTEIAAAQGVKAAHDRAVETHTQLVAEASRMRQQLTTLKEWNAGIERLRGKFAEDSAAGQLAAAVTRTKAEKASAKTRLDEVRARKEPLVERQAKADARVKLLETRAALAAAQKNADRVVDIQAELGKVDAALGGLPDVKASTIDFLRQHEQKITTLETKLAALQATVEVVGTAGATLDGVALAPGETAALPTQSVLRAAGGLELKLVVPGVADADAVRADLVAARAKLDERLAGHIVHGAVATSVQQLADVVVQRDNLATTRADITKRLRSEQAEEVTEALAQAKSELIKAEANDLKLKAFEGWPDPQDLLAARALSQETADAYTRQLQVIREAEDKYRVAEDLAEEAVTKQAAFAKTRRGDEDRLKQLEALRQNLLAEYEDSDEAFTAALTKLERSEGTAGREAQARQKELEDTQLDVLEGRYRRLTASLQNIQNEISAATRDLHQAEGQLKIDGEADPFTDLREADALLARAEVDCQRHTLEAKANTLLHDLFKEQLDAANARVTEPLARQVEAYLKRLFGPRTTVSLTYADGKFGEFQLLRPDMSEHPEAFGTLSGGAREQVAAAVRLATAQLLAEGYGGQLPVVFDDAFVNTDPDRIPKVIDMLFHAEENGLQVIVATCDPSRYQDIGRVKWTVQRGGGAKRS